MPVTVKRLFVALAALLASCGGSPAPPAPSPPLPTTTLRPGTLAGAASWTSPLGTALYALDDGPGGAFTLHTPPGATWAVLPAPGNGGDACVDYGPAPLYPLPNACYQISNGQLGVSVTPGGMALISTQALPTDQPVSIEAVITISLDCTQGVSYIGPVLYNGEGPPTDPSGNYYGLYLSCTGGAVDSPNQAWAYKGELDAAAPVLLSSATYANVSTHALRIDWIPGVSVTWLVDEVVQEVDTSPPAYLAMSQGPHPAIWSGALKGSSYVGRFDWYSGP